MCWLFGFLIVARYTASYSTTYTYVGDSDWLLKETKYPFGGAAFDLVQYRYISPKLMRIVLRDGGACNIVVYLQMNWHGDFYRGYSTDGGSFTVQQGDEWGNWPSGPLASGAPHAYHWNAQWGALFFADLGAPNGGNPPLGLYYVHGRWYNPEVGLFLSPDEMGEYFYGSGQDPVNKGWIRSPLSQGGDGGYACNVATGCTVTFPIRVDCATNACRLDARLNKAVLFYSNVYGIPPELLAATLVTEQLNDKWWYSDPADLVVAMAAGLAELPDPGGKLRIAGNLGIWAIDEVEILHGSPGVGANDIHVQTARAAENHFQSQYQGTDMATLVKPGLTDPQLLLGLLSTDRNIRYAAAILRQLADLRTARILPHLSDLTDVDMAIIYGAYRAGIVNGYGSLNVYQSTQTPGIYGSTFLGYLRPYNGYY